MMKIYHKREKTFRTKPCEFDTIVRYFGGIMSEKESFCLLLR